MSLRDRLLQPGAVVAPGVYDALSASIAEAAGFEAIYLSGAGIAYTRLGRADIGLVSMNEVAEVIGLVRDRVAIPMIVDGDTGYGNAMNVERTVRLFERAGATAIQLEDQTTPKRCGHLRDKSVTSPGEMISKIKAAVDSRVSSQTLIVARTDARAVEGLDAAIDRASRYAEAGADVLFVEAPRSRGELEAIVAELGGRAPLLANMVEGGQTPISSAQELGEIGFSIAIFPGGVVRAVGKTMIDYYGSLAAHGSNQPFRERMFDFDALNAVIGTPDMLARGEAYEAMAAEADAAPAAPKSEETDA